MSRFKLTRETPRILVAEDDRTHQRFIETMLDEMGFNTTIATNGRVAVDLVKEAHFDLILMDCTMPVMTGYEAAKLISDMRSEGTIADIPIIALTANQRKGDPEKCFESGMDDYIAKSLWLPKWKPRIERIIRKWLAATAPGAAKDAKSEIVSTAILSKVQALAGGNFSALVTAYLVESKAQIKTIRSMVASKKTASEIAVPAYALMSSSKEIGAMQISHAAAEVARRLGALGRSKESVSSIASLVLDLEDLYKKTHEILQSKIKK